MLYLNDTQTGLYCRFPHAAIKCHDVSCRSGERKCDVERIESAQWERIGAEQHSFRLPMHCRAQVEPIK